jgi:hypothetical protein
VGEVLIQALELEELETQPDIEYPDVTEQLSFPKLDGILFPIVVANADIIAPCPWMGGNEVSLTTALNNYYQPMTEENADTVIADVFDFLANRIVIDESKELQETETQEDEVDDEKKVSEDATKIPQRPSYKDKRINTEKRVQTQSRVTKAPAVPQMARAVAPVRENRETAREDLTKVEREPIDEAPTSSVHQATIPEESPDMPRLLKESDIVSIRDDSKMEPSDTPDQDVAIRPVSVPSEPETSDEHETEDIRPVFAVDMIRPAVPDVGLRDIEELSHQETEPDLTLPEQLEDIADIVADDPGPIGEEDRSIEARLASTVQEPDAEDSGAEAWSEILASNEDNPDVSEEQGAEDKSQVETDDLEPSVQSSLMTEKINGLLMDLTRQAEIDESDILEIANKLVDEIAEMSLNLEVGNDDEVTTNETDIKKELRESYVELLDTMTLGHKEELADLLTYVTLELQAKNLEADATEGLDEIDDKVLHTIIHKQIKGLAVIVSTMKKALARVMAVGRSALMLHIVNPAKDINCKHTYGQQPFYFATLAVWDFSAPSSISSHHILTPVNGGSGSFSKV